MTRISIARGAFLFAIVSTSACSVETSDRHESTASASESLSFSNIKRVPYDFQTAWTDVGAPFGGDPTLVSWGKGRVDLFMRNGDQLIQKANSGHGWEPAGDHYWYITSGLASDPSAVGWWNKNIDIVFRAPGGNVMHVYWDGSWHTEDLGGKIEGKPTISVAPDGTRMDVFARVGNQVWHRGWAGFINAWGNWEPIGVTVDSDPVAVSWGRGHVDLFARTSTGDTQRFTWDGISNNTSWTQSLNGVWKQQASLGPFAKGSPSVASQGVGSLDVFIQGSDDGIWRKTLSGYTGTWGPWYPVVGCQLGTPSVAVSDSLNIAVRDKNSHRILENWEWTFPSTTPGAAPTCCGLMNQNSCALDGCAAGLATSTQLTCVGFDRASHDSCVKARNGFMVENMGPRYNDIYFRIWSPANVRWGWKITSGNLQAQGEASAGDRVAVSEHFFGPPWAISPKTTYQVSFYPGGLSSDCAPMKASFVTPESPQPECAYDHTCGNDPTEGDGSEPVDPPGPGEEEDGQPCTKGEPCWPPGL